jgi:hypothetical protein
MSASMPKTPSEAITAAVAYFSDEINHDRIGERVYLFRGTDFTAGVKEDEFKKAFEEESGWCCTYQVARINDCGITIHVNIPVQDVTGFHDFGVKFARWASNLRRPGTYSRVWRGVNGISIERVERNILEDLKIKEWNDKLYHATNEFEISVCIPSDFAYQELDKYPGIKIGGNDRPQEEWLDSLVCSEPGTHTQWYYFPTMYDLSVNQIRSYETRGYIESVNYSITGSRGNVVSVSAVRTEGIVIRDGPSYLTQINDWLQSKEMQKAKPGSRVTVKFIAADDCSIEDDIKATHQANEFKYANTWTTGQVEISAFVGRTWTCSVTRRADMVWVESRDACIGDIASRAAALVKVGDSFMCTYISDGQVLIGDSSLNGAELAAKYAFEIEDVHCKAASTLAGFSITVTLCECVIIDTPDQMLMEYQQRFDRITARGMPNKPEHVCFVVNRKFIQPSTVALLAKFPWVYMRTSSSRVLDKVLCVIHRRIFYSYSVCLSQSGVELWLSCLSKLPMSPRVRCMSTKSEISLELREKYKKFFYFTEITNKQITVIRADPQADEKLLSCLYAWIDAIGDNSPTCYTLFEFTSEPSRPFDELVAERYAKKESKRGTIKVHVTPNTDQSTWAVKSTYMAFKRTIPAVLTADEVCYKTYKQDDDEWKFAATVNAMSPDSPCVFTPDKLTFEAAQKIIDEANKYSKLRKYVLKKHAGDIESFVVAIELI